MNIEDQIHSLLAHAEPLRALDDDDPAKAPLAGIVDEINRLRAVQERQALQGEPGPVPPAATEEGADATLAATADKPKRRGGRPRKDATQ